MGSFFCAYTRRLLALGTALPFGRLLAVWDEVGTISLIALAARGYQILVQWYVGISLRTTNCRSIEKLALEGRALETL